MGGWELSVLQQGDWVLGELARVKAEQIPTPLPPVFTREPFFLPLFPSSPQFGRKPASQPSAGDEVAEAWGISAPGQGLNLRVLP